MSLVQTTKSVLEHKESSGEHRTYVFDHRSINTDNKRESRVHFTVISVLETQKPTNTLHCILIRQFMLHRLITVTTKLCTYNTIMCFYNPCNYLKKIVRNISELVIHLRLSHTQEIYYTIS